jgi:hypothetical protein
MCAEASPIEINISPQSRAMHSHLPKLVLNRIFIWLFPFIAEAIQAMRDDIVFAVATKTRGTGIHLLSHIAASMAD